MKKELIEHHTKYKEIHGFDETAWMTVSEHRTLHSRLRKNGKCNIPVDELRKISKLAHSRTKKSIEARRKYRNSKRGKKVHSEYRKSKEGRKVIDDYNQSERKKELQRKNHKKYYEVEFSESPGTNTEFREKIVYNIEDGSVKYYSRFSGHTPHKLVFINI